MMIIKFNAINETQIANKMDYYVLKLNFSRSAF